MASASTSLSRGESNVLTINAEDYTAIEHRGSPQAHEEVHRVLNRLIDAVPTSVHPDVRATLLEALLEDLEDREDSTWTQWSLETTASAMAAIKALSRNPIGSEVLSLPKSINTVLHHTALPLPPAANPFSTPPHPSSSLVAGEALKVIANLLVLRPETRKWAASKGIGAVIARDMAGMDETSLPVERIFLVSRIGFLVAVDGGKAVEGMIEENVVESSATLLSSLSLVPQHYMAITELLKLIHAVLGHAPSKTSDSDQDSWPIRFDIILAPLLDLLHNLPQTTLSPPLAQVIHALLLVPFVGRLRLVWLASGGTKAVQNTSTSSPARTFKNLFGTLSTPDLTAPRRSIDSGRLSPTPPPVEDAGILPRRLLAIIKSWFERFVPCGTDIDGDQVRRIGVDVDADLPPITLLIAKLCAGDASVRRAVREAVLPDDLDRTPEAGPLEQRASLLGDLLRVLTCSNHPQSRAAMEEFFWALANGNSTTLNADIGYGNAAGLLFRKGISAPETATIRELPDAPENKLWPTSGANAERHPISGLADLTPGGPSADMTDEEKEREAERLFVLFERMERNKVISTGAPGGQGVDMMRKAVAEGKGEEWERLEEAKRLRKAEEDDERDEAEAMRELEALKLRRKDKANGL